ncbi:uncharacterized protein LOC117910054 [Vitis riparia]|uniref:uncharacterized protein LOC117910054 n=1 Tax=Vitis riparia TaxID=96939 RepID=UPI00155B23FB|nr:uncharacterized protein LOC117910054 [Vitis riparia]
MQTFPESIRKLWNEWEIHLMVLLSLFLQIVLIIFSNRRKYTFRPWNRILIWSAYVSADWVATVALGILSRSQGDSQAKHPDPNYTLMAFWTPFLLLHLGGPDTITAYSLEDHELWLRHAWTGCPSWGGFLCASEVLGRDSTHISVHSNVCGWNYQVWREDLGSQRQFRRLYADLILTFFDKEYSELIIRSLPPEEAFKVVEMEISFMYDVLYTKATVVYSLPGILLRTASFFSTISTLAAFCFFIDKHQFSTIDINITYILLFGAIFLEIYAIMVLILSDWSIIWFRHKNNNFLIDSICRAITCFRSVLTSDKRWSRRMAQNNLIDSCLRDKTKFDEVPRFFDMNKFLERYWYMTWENVDDMKEPIFSCLLEMTNNVDDPKQLLKHRGDYVISKIEFIKKLGWSVVDVEFDHSILVWHIATDLFYPCDVDKSPDTNLKTRCKISKCLSEYMLYLLVMCPFMLPKGIGEFRFRDTCSDAKRFFQQRSESISSRNEACRLLLEVYTELEPRYVKGDKSKSV